MPRPELLPAVARFLATHPEFGWPAEVRERPDWARGQRQAVTFGSGRSLLFYTRGGRVVTVYDADFSERVRVVWGCTDRSGSGE